MPTREPGRTKDTLAELRPHISSTRELPGGYALLIAGHSSPVLALIELLSLEELSCPSVKIELAEGDRDAGDAVWVHFTGGDCVKKFLRNELVGG
ncbi:MAG: hypothetical protein ACE5GX_11925 [Thermoanaerobaculia bacterium]